MRPAMLLAGLLLALGALDGALLWQGGQRKAKWSGRALSSHTVTAALGLTDLCLATEARYTRNPAVSDPLAPFMDHPGSLEHFPTGSFWGWPGENPAGDKP